MVMSYKDQQDISVVFHAIYLSYCAGGWVHPGEYASSGLYLVNVDVHLFAFTNDLPINPRSCHLFIQSILLTLTRECS